MIDNIINMFKDKEQIRSISKTKQHILYPSLTQGNQFNKYKNKIINNLAKNANILSGKEGFTNSTNSTNSTDLTNQSNSIINNNNLTNQQQLNTDILKQEYEDTLKVYQKINSKITEDISNYVNRVNPNNPYLNQNIMFSDGTIAYVTNQGLVKQYESNKILNKTSGQNGCPGKKYVNLNIPWDNNYTQGDIIPTIPPLIVGSSMMSGQSCGHEGNNVFVDKFLSNITPSYMGCYNPSSTNDNMTFIGGAPTSSNTSGGTYTYEQCSQSAIQQGFQYFALQNVNTDNSTGYCAVSNNSSVVSQYGTAKIPSKIDILWSSNTSNQTGNSAILTVSGSLSVINSSGKAVYNTPSTNATPSNYLGCYADTSNNNAMSLYNKGSQQYNLEQCQQAAESAGNSYFGLQNSSSGTNAQCTLSNSFADSTKYGSASNCTDVSGGYWSGGGLSNAVYSTGPAQSNYYLILKNNGNMSIHRGTGPSDNQGKIWSSNTKGKQKEPNSNMSASNSKYGQNWMSSGATLSAGDFIGSNNGSIALVMQTDGNLVLNTYEMTNNCQTMSDGNIGGGELANASYNIGKMSNVKNIGQLAYIDADSNLYNYPSTNQTYTNKYNVTKNANTKNNDIKGASFNNATVNSCTNYCNNNLDCAGFVLENDVCYPKTNKMYPFGGNFTSETNSSIYNRNVIPLNLPSGVFNKTHNIDTVKFNNYINKGDVGSSYGLSNVSEIPKQVLEQLQTKINSLSSQLSSLTTGYNSSSTLALQQTSTNNVGVNEYINEISQTNEQIKDTSSNNNFENILNDSNIVILQKNYEYLFWSILAIGIVLISMNVIKSNNVS